jgi:hypothetical protein
MPELRILLRLLLAGGLVGSVGEWPSLGQDGDGSAGVTFTDGYSAAATLRAPAVSQVNGKLSYAGGNMNSYAGHNVEGSVAVPVGEAFGLQTDALYSRVGDTDFYGGAGHFFWRNPATGLVGLAGGGLHADGVDVFQGGVEASRYVGRFTLGAFAGVGAIRYRRPVVYIDTRPTDFVGRLSADWYPTDELRVGISGMTAFGDWLGRADLEYQTPLRGVALTAEAAVGRNSYDHWLLGVRYYFGSAKSLRARQREDDPPGLMPQILQSLGLYGAAFDHAGADFFAAHPEAGTWTGDVGYGIDINRDQIRNGVVPGDPPPTPPTPPGDPTGPSPQ